MPYREATYRDIAPGSEILSKAFKNDGFQGRYLHPHLDKYPDDLVRHYSRTLRAQWARVSDDHKLYVAYKPGPDGQGEECLTGIASWSRRRSKPQPATWTTRGWTAAVDYYNKLDAWLYPDRAADPERLKILVRAAPYSKHLWTGSRADVWYLNVIAVDPAFEGQGIGRELVALGFDHARKDGVGTSCIAASGRDEFYKACGFDVQCGIAGDEGPDHALRAELRSIGGGMVHFWDGGKEPQGVQEYIEHSRGPV